MHIILSVLYFVLFLILFAAGIIIADIKIHRKSIYKICPMCGKKHTENGQRIKYRQAGAEIVKSLREYLRRS